MLLLVCLLGLVVCGPEASGYIVHRYPRQAQSENVTQTTPLASSSTAPTSIPPTVVTSTDTGKIACPRPTFCAPLSFCVTKDTVFDAELSTDPFQCGRTPNTFNYVCCRNQERFPLRWSPSMEKWFLQLTPTSLTSDETNVLPWEGFNTEQLGSLSNVMRVSSWSMSSKTRRQAPPPPSQPQSTTPDRLPDRIFFLSWDQIATKFNAGQQQQPQQQQPQQDERKRRELFDPRRPPKWDHFPGPRPQRTFG